MAYRGSGITAPYILNLGHRWKCVVSHTSRSFNFWNTLKMRLGGPHRRFPAPARIGTPVIGRPFRSLDTILTELSRLKYRI